MSRLFMVRHAQASFGGPDYDRLSAVGQEQAGRLGAHWAEQKMAFDAVFVGPRRRHQQTAELVGECLRQRGLPWPELVLLPEVDEYAGLDVFRLGLPKLAEREAAFQALAQKHNHQDLPVDARLELLKLFQEVVGRWVRGELPLPGVETWQEFRARARRGLTKLLEAGASGSRDIVVFTSTGPVAAALDLAFGLDDQRLMEASWQVRNTAVSEFLFSAPRFSLSVFNALPHLPPGELVTHI
jgi:broad specificity phosphatase PhoE